MGLPPTPPDDEAKNGVATRSQQPLRFLDELWDHQVETHPKDVVFSIPAEHRQGSPDLAEEAIEWQTYSFDEADGLAQRIAARYARLVHPRIAGRQASVIAFVATGSISTLINQIAVMKLGHIVALFSPNNSLAALVHLIKSTDTQVLFHSADQAAVVREAKEQLRAERFVTTAGEPIAVHQWLDLQTLRMEASSPAKIERLLRPAVKRDPDDCAFILHSSGSTGFPKPIRLSHKSFLAAVCEDRSPDLFSTLPVYHYFGLACAWRCILSTSKIFLASGILNTGVLVPMMKASTAQWLATVPFVLKLVSERVEGLQSLAAFDLVVFGGSFCPTPVGDALVKHGVKLMTQYGTTEFGSIGSSLRDFEKDSDWEYIRVFASASPFARFDRVDGIGAGGDAIRELVIHQDWPALTKVGLKDGYYHSKDLFVAHRTVPHAYKYVGRLDDTLVHLNGEKTNPVPMEGTIRASPFVTDCTMFGAGRALAGVLILPSDTAMATVRDVPTESLRRLSLWKLMLPVVEEANRDAPSHSQIVPELVKVLPYGTKFPTSDKGSLIRAKTITAFEGEIEQAYRDYDEGQTLDRVDPSRMLDSIDDIVAAVEGVVSSLMSLPKDTDILDRDLVELGLNSLIAARIRNKLQQMVASPKLLPSNLVFEHPTIRKLAEHIRTHDERTDRDSCPVKASTRSKVEDKKTEELVKKFRSAIRLRLASEAAAEGEQPNSALLRLGNVVLLTGSTGSLGAHLLHQLCRRRRTSRIICLNRALSDADARERLERSLSLRRLPTIKELEMLGPGPDGVRIENLAADYAQDGLGLSESKYKELLDTVDTVIHNAWPVNFNMSVESFVPSIQGAVNLLNLAALSRSGNGPARYLFSSSVSAAMGRKSIRVDETFSSDPSEAGRMGYARSKWIVERLCQIAGDEVGGGFEAVALRIGQMIGDTVKGIWNETEAVPLMIRAAKTLGCLPDLRDEKVNWIGVDIAAQIIARLATAPPVLPVQGAEAGSGSTADVVHVVNPILTSYRDIFDSLARPSNLGPIFELVPPSEWVQQLYSSSDQDPESNPTLKLREHYMELWGKGASEESGPGDGQYFFETVQLKRRLLQGDGDGSEGTNTRDDGQTLEPRGIDADHIGKIVATWKKSGFL